MKTTALLLLAPLALLAQEPVVKPPPGPVVGKPAPTIRLNDHTGVARSVGGEAEAWRVIACYPKAMTGG